MIANTLRACPEFYDTITLLVETCCLVLCGNNLCHTVLAYAWRVGTDDKKMTECVQEDNRCFNWGVFPVNIFLDTLFSPTRLSLIEDLWRRRPGTTHNINGNYWPASPMYIAVCYCSITSILYSTSVLSPCLNHYHLVRRRVGKTNQFQETETQQIYMRWQRQTLKSVHSPSTHTNLACIEFDSPQRPEKLYFNNKEKKIPTISVPDYTVPLQLHDIPTMSPGADMLHNITYNILIIVTILDLMEALF